MKACSSFGLIEADLEMVECAHCSAETVRANLQMCLLCPFTDSCSSCYETHRLTHTRAEFEKARLEICPTPREELNEEIKQQIRAQAETICRLIDNQEQLLKAKERQVASLAEALDRATVIQ